jgi:tetratricopeptide (TPR) repeat protein
MLLLPEEAVPFMVMAVRVHGWDALRGGDGGRGADSGEAVGQRLLGLVFGLQVGKAHPGVLDELARDPHSRRALGELTHLVYEAFQADQALASEAAAVIAASYRRRANTGDTEALIELGDFLYWDEPEAARAAYQEAVEAGHLPAMIGLGRVLSNVLEDEEAAFAVFEQAAASGDADVSAEAMYEIAHATAYRDVAVRSALLERAIDTRHPAWAAAAMIEMAFLLKQDDPEGAEALVRRAIREGDADRSAHASALLGDLLERKGEVDEAKAIWERLINSRHADQAGAAFISLVNLLTHQEDTDGLRAAYLHGVALDNPEAPVALLQLGQLLEARGDADRAHEAWRQAIDAGCKDPGYWQERMSPAPKREPEVRVYPPGLPPEFDPANVIRAGIEVLEHGLPPLPGVLRHEMAIPVAYWVAGQCAVVLVLQYMFPSHGHDEPMPMAMQASYSRGADGRWEPPARIHGTTFSPDPLRNPESIWDQHRPMVGGGMSLAGEATPGHPFVIATGRAAPEVKYLAVVKDGHEDRRPLESHFGAWVVCTEEPGPFEIEGLDANGAVLASLPYASQPRWLQRPEQPRIPDLPEPQPPACPLIRAQSHR